MPTLPETFDFLLGLWWSLIDVCDGQVGVAAAVLFALGMAVFFVLLYGGTWLYDAWRRAREERQALARKVNHIDPAKYLEGLRQAHEQKNGARLGPAERKRIDVVLNLPPKEKR